MEMEMEIQLYELIWMGKTVGYNEMMLVTTALVDNIRLAYNTTN